MRAWILSGYTGAFFGGIAQFIVGALMVILTIGQTIYWKYITHPSVDAIFLVSMEALFFAGYGVMATAIALLKIELMKNADS